MAKYEINGDLWWYGGNEYLRGDVVDVDPSEEIIQIHLKSGFLLAVGTQEKLAKAQAKAEEAQAKADAEQVERDNAEAARRVEEQKILTSNVSSQDGPKTTRRGK